jgi:predicted Zn finger-like uncharacterized protein
MSNVISCPKCDRQLRVPDDLLGQSVKCPGCSETFTAEAPKTEPPPSSRPRDDDPPSRRPPPRREDEEDDYRRPTRSRNLAPHRGDTIQLLGILSFFIAGPILGPMAWIMGNNDLKEMDAGRMDPAGRGSTSTGRMCGMIATILCLVGFGMGILLFGCLCCMPMIAGGGHN